MEGFYSGFGIFGFFQNVEASYLTYHRYIRYLSYLSTVGLNGGAEKARSFLGSALLDLDGELVKYVSPGLNRLTE